MKITCTYIPMSVESGDEHLEEFRSLGFASGYDDCFVFDADLRLSSSMAIDLRSISSLNFFEWNPVLIETPW